MKVASYKKLHSVIAFIEDIRIGKSIETDGRLVVARDLGRGLEVGVTANGYKVLSEVMKCSKIQ